MLQVEDCDMQRVYELLRSWWLEGNNEEISESASDNKRDFTTLKTQQVSSRKVHPK